NFNNVTVAEVLRFLAKQYSLDYDFTGNIIYAKPYMIEPDPIVREPKTIPMTYGSETGLITMELKNDSLPKVVKLLTQKTGNNVVFQPGLENKLLSVYLESVPFDQAMDKLAFANDLQISKTPDNFYLIEKPEPKVKDGENKRFRDLNAKASSGQFYVDSNLISLEVENQPLDQVIRNLFQNLGIDYFLYSRLDYDVTMKVSGERLDGLLEKLFYGTKYTYRKRDSIYIIGERNLEGLRETKRIYLQHRSVEKVIEIIPGDIKQGIEIKEFSELNSLVVSGSYPQILALEEFIESIDRSVPVVVIEVMIVDYQRNNTVSSGIEVGVGDEPVQSGGKIYPGFDYRFGSESINRLLESFDGFGALNLGPVTPNFYVNLRLLEDNGIINVKSTPKLSTLNGHEANISIGNTEYYVVEQTNVAGVQNPLPITTRNYQSVQANFTLTIKPIVSGDEQVTLDIDVEQSDFTARISPQAPPGSVSRKFTSMIRVGNEEMVLLGGLEEKGVNDSGSGVPLLSRIPVLKWLFSSRTRSYNKTKLNIFIKPTILY
ncbi:MAG TPA: general secretion pathway protein GspD, partial [Cryomorphaceae bacterium]|nr:general secretion pathway protein GspD [Cryomorphaceae bacterium]